MKQIVTRLPYLFFLEKKIEAEINHQNKTINIKDKGIFSIKKYNKLYFLTLKYIPIFIIFSLIFNFNDFSMFNRDKAIQYLLAAFLFIIFFMFENEKQKIILFIAGIVSIYVAYSLKNMLILSYAIKYFLLFITIAVFFIDTKKTVFCIEKDNIIKAHLII